MARRQEEAERARFDERWDRLTAGTLTAEEEAELKALSDSSPEAREAYAAFRPLGADFQANVVNAINSERAAEAPAPELWEEKPRSLTFRRVARRMEVWFGAAAAVAAGVFFLVRGPSSIPEYTNPAKISVSSEARGGEQFSPTPGSRLSASLRPSTDVDVRGLTARAFLSRTDGKELHRWKPKPEVKINDKGFVTLRGSLEKGIQPGPWTIWIVVGHEGRLPDIKDLQTELHAGTLRHDHWKAIPTEIEVRLPPR